jgi:hypothetical protein
VTDQPGPPVAADSGTNSFPDRRRLLDAVAREQGIRRVAVLREYLDGLPRPAVARCPYTDAVVRHSVHAGGIDGPWWDYRWPQRPVESLPSTFFAFTGALRLGDALPVVDWLVKTGPEAPFVVPRLLGVERMRAVLTSFTVGGWDAWTITYFTDAPRAVERFNDWGSSRYWLDAQAAEWDAMTEDAEKLDFDLAPWIDRGALLWIAPGDGELRLQSTSAGCPYLGLPGRRSFVRVQDGTSWEPGLVAQ